MIRIGKIFEAYQKLLNRRPYLIQAIQTGGLMGTGDLISQTIIEKKRITHIDYQRTLKFSCIGFFAAGPAITAWYRFLNRHVGSEGRQVAITKVFFDQVIFAPIVLFILFTFLGILQGKSLEIIKKDIDIIYFDILKTNYCVWPFVQILNFYYIPLKYQTLVVQTVALLWNAYLSWKTNKKQTFD